MIQAPAWMFPQWWTVTSNFKPNKPFLTVSCFLPLVLKYQNRTATETKLRQTLSAGLGSIHSLKHLLGILEGICHGQTGSICRRFFLKSLLLNTQAMSRVLSAQRRHTNTLWRSSAADRLHTENGGCCARQGRCWLGLMRHYLYICSLRGNGERNECWSVRSQGLMYFKPKGRGEILRWPPAVIRGMAKTLDQARKEIKATQTCTQQEFIWNISN